MLNQKSTLPGNKTRTVTNKWFFKIVFALCKYIFVLFYWDSNQKKGWDGNNQNWLNDI